MVFSNWADMNFFILQIVGHTSNFLVTADWLTKFVLSSYLSCAFDSIL